MKITRISTSAFILFLLSSLFGCTKKSDQNTEPVVTSPSQNPPPNSEYLTDEDVLHFLPTGMEQIERLCQKAPGSKNRVHMAFCEGAAVKNPQPTINNLDDLRSLLGLNGSNTSFAATAHSSSLVNRMTSAINPRAIIFHTDPETITDYVALSFVRGETFVELMAKDPEDADAATNIQFYLFEFDLPCENSESGCSHGDLLSQEIESGWTGYSVYDEDDLKNTIIDCRQCHQVNGPGTPKLLRMQELTIPWTHWLADESLSGPVGQSLIDDYLAAHTNPNNDQVEEYASVDLRLSRPDLFEDFIRNAGFALQPNEFLSDPITNEVVTSNPLQPAQNTPPGQSSTWDAIYVQHENNSHIAPPYHDNKVTDPSLLAASSAAYRNLLSGAIETDELPDIRKIFLASKSWAMGHTVKSSENDQQKVLNLACGSCHNQELDQSISRARFHVDVSTMTRAQKDAAIYRLKLPEDHLSHMPPRKFKTLSIRQKQALIDFLKN